MADYLFNYAAGALEYGSAPLSDQVRALLDALVWGLPERPRYYRRVGPGDRVIAYAGGGERVFVGDAVVERGYHDFTPQEVARHPGKLRVGVTFSAGRVWPEPVSRDDVWARMGVSKQLLRGSILELSPGDFELVAPPAQTTRADGSRPFDPSRRPAAYGQVRPPDAEAAAALAEKATQDHFDLVVALDARLRAEGWTEVYEIDHAIDLWARDPSGQRHIFEVKTTANELSATRAAIAQLFEYRAIHGAPGDRLCLVAGAPLGERRARVLEALEIDVLVL